VNELKKFINTVEKYLVGAFISFTMWFNTIGVAILASSLADPTLLAFLTERGFIWIIVLGNIVLRVKTDKSLKDKG